jgi:DNA (cytosine-5)-methyltransferase 1
VKVLDLFAGIGGFTIGFEKAGFETVAFCEIEPYAQKVLRKNWPEVPIYDDVRTITAERLVSDGIKVDVITGGFPCQDISVAGNQAGIEGERSGLWTECARLIGEIRPRYAVFENVTNLLNGERGDWFKRVLWDISALGYDAEWHCIPASELGAHHHRDRVWIICYPREVLLENTRHGCGRDAKSFAGGQNAQTERQCNTSTAGGSSKDVADTHGARQQQSNEALAGRSSEQSDSACIQSKEADVSYPNESRLQRWLQDGIAYQAGWEVESDGRATERGVRWERYRDGYWASEPNVGRVVNGIPSRSHRLKCLGNAVVPPIPELIARAINEAD